ncbi:hypothetical protein GPJ56_009765 [Histomonas meleagridis]|uniref:uncharacterized protein n=1 Tax=Histomonas meleagridis TaxID=135588 RepID=UPI00355A1164|nr:hypothetical protein GPJ56_009765 [Histomonas meleagridis]KAH0802326.1 hypothetical protein GO595_004939 [Histomonas meleagridis]
MKTIFEKKSMTISLVDLSDADGSQILSCLTGIPFIQSIPGTVRFGMNFLEKENETINIFGVTFKSCKPEMFYTNAISIFAAISCSNLVIINSNSIKFLLQTLDVLFTFFNEDGLKKMDNKLFGSKKKIRFPKIKFVFINEFGSSPKEKIENTNHRVETLLENASPELQNAFKGVSVDFIDSKLPPIEIAHMIGKKTLELEDTEIEFERIQKAVGFFGAALSLLNILIDREDLK